MEKEVEHYQNDEKAVFKDVFLEQLDKTMPKNSEIRSAVVEGTVLDIGEDEVTVDIGFKSEGVIPILEFEGDKKLEIGDKVEVFVVDASDENGNCLISRMRAKREEIVKVLEEHLEKKTTIPGKINWKMRNGFIASFKGINIFVPMNHLDEESKKQNLIGKVLDFRVIYINNEKNSIVVSRRYISEKAWPSIEKIDINKICVGEVIEGIVKNITEYGAFINLGDIDALLHITDISWKRIKSPDEKLTVGAKKKFKVIKFDPKTKRISLGLKQLTPDPWKEIGNKYKVGEKIQGKVVTITSYGVFIEIEEGIEGLIHLSEIDWFNRNIDLHQMFSIGQKVDAIIIESNIEKRRIALSYKRNIDSPWIDFGKKHQEGNVVEVKIEKIGREFLLAKVVGFRIRGIIKFSNIAWQEIDKNKIAIQYPIDKVIKVKIIEIIPEKEKLNLSIKHLLMDEFARSIGSLKRGDKVLCTVNKVSSEGLNVKLENGIDGFIPTNHLSSKYSEMIPERFSPGNKISALVLSISKTKRQVSLSIKNLEITEKEEALESYGSVASGARLGDVLGVALEKKTKTQKKEGKNNKKRVPQDYK